MGKLAQKFNLSQGKRKDVEQAETSDASAKGRLPTSQSYPVQLQGSQVLRRNDGFDFPMAFHSMASEPLADPRSYHARSLGASPGLMATESRAYKMSMEIDSPEITTPEQRKVLELEQRLKVATQRVQDLEDDARTHEEELMVARTQAKIDIDQEVVRLQQEVETLEQHEERLIRELVISESKLKGLKTTERDLKKRLSHFHTIYCLKHAYNAHLKKMSPVKQRTAQKLHGKFEETEAKYMEAAFALYDYLEANGLQDTLPANVKEWLANPKGKKS
ncbi:hypothetical protein N8I77_001405 [Diaporthe amygdali]|uniref:Uncharacterized protein n=1 Tax=Phomopsis amygdali TaxID=1214568 RepID=A0AAD9WA48_PHOAM|nr:hypothetical protein N8I77_001405 [Diaporthe amygdali]